MEIYILRHAIAEMRDPLESRTDSERALTPEGIAKMEQIARGMKALELTFDLILSSPFRRAKQTADIVVRTLRIKKRLLRTTRRLAAGSDPAKLAEELRRLGAKVKRVLLVGHEPDLSELISLLLSGDSDLGIQLKKGGLCKLTSDSLQFGGDVVLEWFGGDKFITMHDLPLDEHTIVELIGDDAD